MSIVRVWMPAIAVIISVDCFAGDGTGGASQNVNSLFR